MSTAETVRGGKIYVKPLNYACGLACVATGGLCLLGGDKSTLYGWLAPVYFVAFGLIMLAADLNIEVIIRSCPFLDKYIGRGLFNIFVAAQILDMSKDAGNGEGAFAKMFYAIGDIVGWAIMILGVYLVVLHFLESDTSINGIKNSLKKQAATALIKSQFK